MSARLFQVSFIPKGFEGKGIEDTVQLFALNKQDAIAIVKEEKRVGEIINVTSRQDEFIPLHYCALFRLTDDDEFNF